MRLLGTRVVIQPHVQDKIGSIHLARMSRQMPNRGTVLHISDKGRAMWNNDVLPGTEVIFDKHHQKLADDEKTTEIDAKHLLAIILK